MAGDWLQDENGVWRRATQPHMGRRLSGFDYRRRGCYVVTLVLADRQSRALGEIVVRNPVARAALPAEECEIGGGAARGRAANVSGGEKAWLSIDEARGLGLRPDEIEAKVIYSQLGRAMFSHFWRMGDFTRGLKPVYCSVMPDHLHLLVEIVSELERPLGNAIGGFKTGCEKIFAKMGGEGRLFEPGFVDQIVLRAGQLASEFDYLKDNPRRLAVKRLFPELFRVTRRVKVDFRLAPKAPNGGREGAAETGLVSGGGERRAVCRAPAAPAAGWFSAIGNHFLLTRSDLRQVQCSRRFFTYARDERGRPNKDAPPAVVTREFTEKLEAALDAARHGAVIVSPCISQGEREIARRVFAAGGRVIALRNAGFSPLYKPGGQLFDRCANGNLLLLAPIGWPYQPATKPMTRGDALVLNRIAQLIAGSGAVEIDYKGVVIGDVDADVTAAVVRREGAPLT